MNSEDKKADRPVVYHTLTPIPLSGDTLKIQTYRRDNPNTPLSPSGLISISGTDLLNAQVEGVRQSRSLDTYEDLGISIATSLFSLVVLPNIYIQEIRAYSVIAGENGEERYRKSLVLAQVDRVIGGVKANKPEIYMVGSSYEQDLFNGISHTPIGVLREALNKAIVENKVNLNSNLEPKQDPRQIKRNQELIHWYHTSDTLITQK